MTTDFTPADIERLVPMAHYIDAIGLTDILKRCGRPRDIQFNLRSVFEDGVLPVLEHYLDLRDEYSYDALFCWIIGGHVIGVFDSFPYLYFAGMKRCGKSRSLVILSKLARDPILTVNCSVAAAFRLAEAGSTLLFDEMELLNSKNEDKADLRLLFTSGYRRGSQAIRVEKDEKGNGTIRRWNVYCPKAMASIQRPDDVVADRCITITMLRSMNVAVVNQFIEWEIAPTPIPMPWTTLQDVIKTVALSKKAEIEQAYRELKAPTLVGRDWEMWRPLLAVAKVIGEDYYEHLQSYAIKMSASKADEDDMALEVAILPALKQLAAEGKGRVILHDLLKKLKEGDESFVWLNSKYLAKCIRNMGRETKLYHGHTSVFVSSKDVELMAARLSISLSDIEIEKERNTGEQGEEVGGGEKPTPLSSSQEPFPHPTLLSYRENEKMGEQVQTGLNASPKPVLAWEDMPNLGGGTCSFCHAWLSEVRELSESGGVRVCQTCWGRQQKEADLACRN